MTATRKRGRYRRRRRARSEETREEQLARIQASENESNYPAIIEGFKARGIPVDQIRPRENVLTYRAWQAKGRQVRKGEKSVKIDVWIEYDKKSDDGKPATDPEGNPVKGRSRRSVAVFHVSQTDPIESDKPLPDSRPESDKPESERRTGSTSADDASSADRSTSKPAGRRGVSAQRLRELADNMESKIEAKLRPAIAQQRYTARRARIAASMREDGYRLQDIQSARRKMADAIDAGALPECLLGVYSESDIGRLLMREAPQHYLDNMTDQQREARAWLLGESSEQIEAERQARDDQRRRDSLRDDIMSSPPDGFFPTPSPLAARMVELACIAPGMEVLEPSAGMGHIAEAITDHICKRAPGATLITVEVNRKLCEYLENEGHPTHCADIMDVSGAVDRVVMNPPYERKQDLRHVRHCFDMLKPDGRLVALISAGFQYRADRETCDFRDWLENSTIVDRCEILEDAFSGTDSLRQTGVRVALLQLRKPGGSDE